MSAQARSLRGEREALRGAWRARARGWQWATPPACHTAAGRLLPWCVGAGLLCGAAGLALGLGIAPSETLQGDADRILVVHVPAAWMSMLVYLAMALSAAAGLVLDSPVASMLARALAPTGALMTFLALWTGALWGKPTWGAWWVWDARLVSELLLLLLYIACIALQLAPADARRGDRASAVLALVGAINLPVVYFSVRWWHTHHQGAAVALAHEPGTAPAMRAALWLMCAAFAAWSVAAALHRLRSILLEQDVQAEWAQRLGQGAP